MSCTTSACVSPNQSRHMYAHISVCAATRHEYSRLSPEVQIAQCRRTKWKMSSVSRHTEQLDAKTPLADTSVNSAHLHTQGVGHAHLGAREVSSKALAPKCPCHTPCVVQILGAPAHRTTALHTTPHHTILCGVQSLGATSHHPTPHYTTLHHNYRAPLLPKIIPYIYVHIYIYIYI